MRTFRPALVSLLAVLAAGPVGAKPARSVLPGPVPFEVVKVHDGDSFSGEALIWPGHRVRVNVRVRGIDAPEMNARCESERGRARIARQMLAARLREARHVRLLNIGQDKYGGRVIADVDLGGEADLASMLLQAALVRPYSGGKRAPWCD